MGNQALLAQVSNLECCDNPMNVNVGDGAMTVMEVVVNPVVANPIHVLGFADPTPPKAAGPEVVEVKFDDGSIYTGQMWNGKRHGRGRWTFANGMYDGQWEDDVQSGEGVQQWDDGRSYVGHFADGAFDGMGRMDWITPKGPMSYEGQYRKDKKDGKGKFSWADGRVYSGQWADGKRHGVATYKSTSGLVRRGRWDHDRLQVWIMEDGTEVAAPRKAKKSRGLSQVTSSSALADASPPTP